MSDLAVLACILIVVCVIVYLGAVMYNRHVGAASIVAKVRWQLEEHGDSYAMRIIATRPGTPEHRCLASIPWDDPNFDENLEEARINCDTKLHTLNRGLPK